MHVYWDRLNDTLMIRVDQEHNAAGLIRIYVWTLESLKMNQHAEVGSTDLLCLGAVLVNAKREWELEEGRNVRGWNILFGHRVLVPFPDFLVHLCMCCSRAKKN
eukprot:TRINITY_DN11591_c0_g1_i1.p1 TRINITY_DN11591_c0_g1~~TRINITY_DN11591_c0_g1_i1.p1  ORF type:complete len:104 (+),score=11.96 TRINITY_DN11591_c0_g1_i1:413-724(+)